MKTEIIALAKQAQEASDELRATISELHLRIRGGLPPEELAMVEAKVRQLEASLARKISKETERIKRGGPPPTRIQPGGLMPA